MPPALITLQRERRLHAHATPGARRQWRSPPGFFRNEVERRLQPRRFSQHAAAEGDRIGSSLPRQLVYEALDGENIVVRPDTAPETGRYRGRLGPHVFDVQVGNVVGNVDGAWPTG